MSILITGMDMPTDGRLFAVIIDSASGEVMRPREDGVYAVADGAKAVPVPPHGRLIDADAYEALIRGRGDREYRREKGTICDAIKFLHPHYAPTIIEAEEGEK